MFKETCIDVGKILKLADNIHLSYYSYNNLSRISSAPSVLVGGICLSLVVANPYKGLQELGKRLAPFLKFAETIRGRRDSTEKDRVLYGGYVKRFNNVLKAIFEQEDVKMSYSMSDIEKNIVMMEYFN
jgi:hypothetical protein